MNAAASAAAAAAPVNMDSQRNAVVSAANLLMVTLLKLNRVLVPAMLRLIRSRRRQWIRCASRDVARELARSPYRRRLCVGSCCGGSYGAVVSTLTGRAVRAAPMEHTYKLWMEVTSGQLSEPPSSAPQLAAAPSLPPPAHPHPASSPAAASPHPSDPLLPDAAAAADVEAGLATTTTMKLPAGWTEDDVYYRLRVLEEERHRANNMQPIVFTAFFFVQFTILTMIVYGAAIIAIVLLSVDFSLWEAVIFSFTLIATATVSEADTLLQTSSKYNIAPRFITESRKNDDDVDDDGIDDPRAVFIHTDARSGAAPAEQRRKAEEEPAPAGAKIRAGTKTQTQTQTQTRKSEADTQADKGSSPPSTPLTPHLGSTAATKAADMPARKSETNLSEDKE